MPGYLSYMKGFERPGEQEERSSPYNRNNWISPGGIKMQDIRTSTGGQLVGRIYTWPDGPKEARDTLGAVKAYYMPGPDFIKNISSYKQNINVFFGNGGREPV